MGTERRPNATPATHLATPRPRISVTPLVVVLGLLATAGLVLPGANAAPAAPQAARVATAGTIVTAPTTPDGSWAWGALANVSYSAEFVGAYNATENMTGGNLTSAGASIALDEQAAYQYAAYAVVNATTPSNGTRYVTMASVEERALALGIAASGTFPAAGTYGPNRSIPLVPMNVSLAATIVVLTAYQAYLNFTTGPNGSLALANEHLRALKAFNISLVTTNFPNVTRDVSGNEVLAYRSQSLHVTAWIADDLQATFSPALALVQGPLSVGKMWNATATGRFAGTAAYAATYLAASGGSTARWSQSALLSANTTVRVALDFRVVGTQTIVYPDGSAETDFVIAYSNGTGNAGDLVANGLAVVPAADPTHGAGIANAVEARPAAAPATTNSAVASESLYSTSRGLPDSSQASPAAGTSVLAHPVAPANAQRAIATLRAPATASPGVPSGVPAAWVPLLGIAVAVIVGILAVKTGQEVLRYRRRR
jgi:hypothetical protein